MQVPLEALVSDPAVLLHMILYPMWPQDIGIHISPVSHVELSGGLENRLNKPTAYTVSGVAYKGATIAIQSIHSTKHVPLE